MLSISISSHSLHSPVAGLPCAAGVRYSLILEQPNNMVDNWLWGIHRRTASFNGVCTPSATTDRARLEGHVNLQNEIEVTSLIESPYSEFCVNGERTVTNINRTIAHEKKHAAFYVELANRYQGLLGTVYDDFAKCEGRRKELLGQFEPEYANLKQQQADHTDFCGEPRTQRQCVVPAEDYNAIVNGLKPKPAARESPSGTYPCVNNMGLDGGY